MNKLAGMLWMPILRRGWHVPELQAKGVVSESCHALRKLRDVPPEWSLGSPALPNQLFWRTARGACLLLWLCSFAAAQAPSVPPNPGTASALPQGSMLENPFPEQRPGYSPLTDEPLLPLLPPGIPPALPPGQIQPGVQQPPPPATIGELLFGDNRRTPDDYRSGAFQKLSFTNTYLPRMGGDGFGVYGIELTSVWGLPCPTKDAPLVITPGIGTQWLDGPAGLDIPAQLHEVYTEFRWLPKLGDSFRADIALQPGFYSDWDGSSDRAIRIMGHGAGVYDWTPTFQIVLGAAYLDRPDIELLPIAGFIWKPDPGVEYHLVFPTPKISWCIDSEPRSDVPNLTSNGCLPPANSSQFWFYIAGELGGGTWAIRHTDGTSDLMSYSDIRAFLGLENRTIVGLGSQVEVGYVFHRYIRLTSTDTNFDLGDTLMVRAALNY